MRVRRRCTSEAAPQTGEDSSGAGELKGDRAGVPCLRERSNSDDSNKADAGVRNRTRRFPDGVQGGGIRIARSASRCRKGN